MVKRKNGDVRFANYREASLYKVKHRLEGQIVYDITAPTGEKYYIKQNDKKVSDSYQKRRDRAERTYERNLNEIVKDIRKICKEADTPDKAIKKMRDYVKSEKLENIVRKSVISMTTSVDKGQYTTWKEAAFQTSNARKIYEGIRTETLGTAEGEVIKKILSTNAKLIKTCTLGVSEKITEFVNEQTMKGLRYESMMPELRKLAPHLTATQLRRIARTETAKAHTALQEARCDRLGLPWYQWWSCRDQRVRGAVSDKNSQFGGHAAMHGIYCRWSDPPNPEVLFPYDGSHNSGAGYHPGNIYNCRCIPLPVVRPEDVKFPARCHVGGRIVVVNTVEEFKRL